jgi:hypothetical protein
MPTYNDEPILCLFCREPVVTASSYFNGGGTYWTHADGYRACHPTYASPNLLPQWAAETARRKAAIE